MFRRLLMAAIVSLALALAVAWSATSGALAGEPFYGAISYSPSSGATGWGYDFRDRDDAAEAAQRNCRRFASDCKVVTWFKDGCGAVAANAEDFEGAWSRSRDDALTRAMFRCLVNGPGCSVVRWVCTTNSAW